MKQLSHSFAIVLQPLERFFLWLQENATKELDHFEASAIYLPLPPSLDLKDYLISKSENILLSQFSPWCSDEERLPLRRDIEILIDFFHLEAYSCVFDLSKKSKSTRLAILKPTEGFKAWIEKTGRALGEKIEDNQIPLEYYRANAGVYLLPSTVNTGGQAVEFINAEYQSILEEELGRYVKDKTYWPGPLDFELLTSWFEFSSHPIVSPG